MAAVSGAQDKIADKYKLTSETLNQKSKDLDSQIKSLNKKLAEIVKKYNLLNTPKVSVVPYQMNYVLGSNFIEMEKHVFKKDELYERDVVGLEVKKIKIYTDGQNISRIESQIYERNYYSGTMHIVTIVDPSPLAEGTDGIIFTNIMNGKVILENKKLGEIKNTTAHPIRNDLKSAFMIPHLTYFSNSLLFIAETYYAGLKDAESSMTNFLKRVVKY
jgi:hypothetical protein